MQLFFAVCIVPLVAFLCSSSSHQNTALAACTGVSFKLESPSPRSESYFGFNLIFSDTGLLFVPENVTVDAVQTRGYVTVFNRSATGDWTPVAEIRPEGSYNNLDYFGSFLAYSDNVLVVSATGDSEFGVNSGSVYLFTETSSGSWTQLAQLFAVDASAGDQFGRTLALSNGTLVVASYGLPGSAYVFRKNATGNWVQLQKILFDFALGTSPRLTTVATSYGDLYFGVTGVEHPDPDSSGVITNVGSCYVFVETAPNTWSGQELLHADPSANDWYSLVTVYKHIVVVSATYKANVEQATSIAGASYVWTETGSKVWSQVAKLVPADSKNGDYFGDGVAISDDFIAVGSGGGKSAEPSGDYTTQWMSGAVYVFVEAEPYTWVQAIKLRQSVGINNDYLGRTGLAIYQGQIFASARNGIEGYTNPGIIYIFPGPICNTDVDDCLSNPCVNGVCDAWVGTYVNGYECICEEYGWTGEFCETEINECDSSPCLNNGTCVDTGLNSFTCSCAGTGFEGVVCETQIDECVGVFCGSGVCMDLIAAYSCNCSDTGFTGDHCDTDIDDCASSPCLNGGFCLDLGSNIFSCSCQNTGFEGSLCEADIDECSSSPCENMGVCLHDPLIPFVFSCDCEGTGFEGDLCQSVYDVCASSPCSARENSICVPLGSVFTCEDVQMPCASSPCFNAASCVDDDSLLNGFSCTCAVGFEGSLCEQDMEIIERPNTTDSGDTSSSYNDTNGGISTDSNTDIYSSVEVLLYFSGFTQSNETIRSFIQVLRNDILPASVGGTRADYTVTVLDNNSDGAGFVVSIEYSNSDNLTPKEFEERVADAPEIKTRTRGLSFQSPTADEDDDDKKTADNAMYFIVIGMLVFLIAMAAICYKQMQKKQKTNAFEMPS